MRLSAFIALLGFTSLSFAQDFKSRLAVTANSSTDSLIEFAQKFKSLGDIQWASFNHRGARIFTTWVEPRSGQPASTLIQAYYLRDKKWHLFLDEAAAARDISVLITPADNRLVYLATDRKEFLSHALTDLKPLHPIEPK